MREVQLSTRVKESLKQVSIRGRMALGTTFLEMVLSEVKIDKEEKELLINLFWQFVEEWHLGEWDDARRKVDMLMSILDFIEGRKKLPFNSSFYNKPKFVLEMVYAVNWIGVDDLYGAVHGYSPTTHSYTVDVLEIGLSNGFNLPPIDPFLKSPITERNGWGNPVPRAFFTLL